MSYAAKTYATFAKAGMSQRDLEASALLKSASTLQAAMATEDERTREAAVSNNRRLWSIFAAAAEDDASPLPPEMRANVLRIANLVFSLTLQALAGRSNEPLQALVNVNRELAAGLRGQ